VLAGLPAAAPQGEQYKVLAAHAHLFQEAAFAGYYHSAAPGPEAVAAQPSAAPHAAAAAGQQGGGGAGGGQCITIGLRGTPATGQRGSGAAPPTMHAQSAGVPSTAPVPQTQQQPPPPPQQQQQQQQQPQQRRRHPREWRPAQAAALPQGSSAPTASARAAPKQDIALFVGVLSAPGNRTARDAIRATWGADARLARVLFVTLGGHTAPEQVALLAEAARHRDMVVVSEVPNSYHNPTHALVALFRAAAAAADAATHVLKTDDDCWVRVPALLDALAALPRQWLYAGHVSRSPVRRIPGDRWEVPRTDWPSDAPITYTWGMATILTMDLVALLGAGGVHLSMAPDKMLWVEDRAVGVWVADVARVRGVSLNVQHMDAIGWQQCRDSDVITANLGRPVDRQMRCLHARGGRCCSASLTAVCCG
jgi:hypothetical protein